MTGGVTFTNATDAPTILVLGGSLTLRDATVIETTTANRPAIEVLGGTVDLGNTTAPGGNTIIISGIGDLIRNASINPLSAIGNTYRIDDEVIASIFVLESETFDALDSPSAGLVTYEADNVYLPIDEGIYSLDLSTLTADLNVTNPVFAITATTGGTAQVLADAKTAQFTAFDNGMAGFSYSVSVEGEIIAVRSANFAVSNVAPTVNLGLNQTVNEGDQVTFSDKFSDPGSGDTHTYLWHITTDNGQVIPDSTARDFSFTPNDNGQYTITYTVTDDDGAFASDTVQVTANNVAPTPVISSISSTRLEGTQIDVTASATDPAGVNDTLTYSYQVFKDSSITAFASGSGINQTAFNFTPDDNGSYRVELTVEDEDGGTTTVDQTITVANLAPTTVDDQYSAEVFTQLVVDINSVVPGVLGNDTDPAGPINDPLVVTTTGMITTTEGATVVMNTDGTFTYDATTSGSLMGLAEGGTLDDSFEYEISDGDGGVDIATAIVTVTGACNNSIHAIDSPSGDGTKALVIRGSEANDKIDIKMGSIANTFSIHIKTGSRHDDHHHHHHGSIGEDGSLHMGTFKFDESADSVSKIIVYGLDGNDDIKVHKNINVMAWLFGGNGDDKLRGGDQDDVMVGGNGNDKLDGKAGRDILIGGNGADKLKGQKDEDILIAASTTYDSNLAALSGIHQEWRSDNSFEDRVKNICNGKGSASGANDAYFLDHKTVAITDGAKDVLDGGGHGSDWLFADADEDKIKHLEVDDLFGLDIDWFDLD